MCTCTWDISTKLYIIAQYTTTTSFAFARDTVVVFCAICIVYTFGMIGVYYSNKIYTYMYMYIITLTLL